MKRLLITFFLGILSISCVSAQTDTIGLNQIRQYINKTVTIKVQTTDFDSKAECWYLYALGFYPNQRFTIMVKKHNGTKPIKLSTDVLIGRQMVYFTGTIVNYDGQPDSSANPDIKKLSNKINVDRPMTIGGTPVMGHMVYKPKTIPVNLKGKLVMIISDQKQIGKKLYPVITSIY